MLLRQLEKVHNNLFPSRNFVRCRVLIGSLFTTYRSMQSPASPDSNESNLVLFPMAAAPKTALLVQANKFQAEVWSAALVSQSITVIHEATDIDLSVMLSQMGEAGLSLPDLVVVDMAAEGMNPFAFCRFCRDQYPTVKVLLTNSTQTQVAESEQRWAVSQGAQDLLPAFQESSLLTDLLTAASRVTQCLGIAAMDQQALIQVLPKLLEPKPDPVAAPEPEPSETVSAPPSTAPKAQRTYRGRPY